MSERIRACPERGSRWRQVLWRILFTGLLLNTLMVAAGWGTSQLRTVYYAAWKSDGRAAGVSLFKDTLMVSWQGSFPEYYHANVKPGSHELRVFPAQSRPRNLNVLGVVGFHPLEWPPDTSGWSVEAPYAVFLPMCLSTAFLAFLPLHRDRRRRWRRSRGLCPACGYNLRATPDHCPECGAMVSVGRVAAGRPSS